MNHNPQPRLARALAVEIIAAAMGHGAPDRRTALGPAYLLNNNLLSDLQASDIPALAAQVIEAVYQAPRASNLEIVAHICQRLASAVSKALSAGHFVCVLGGDHSCAIGTWSGVSVALKRQPYSLIWIDAHADSHTHLTSHSGALHGMPLAALLGQGDARLTKIAHPQPKLRPEHLTLIGIRSYEPEEIALLERLGVRFYLMAEIAERGIDAVLIEAFERAARLTEKFGISIDLDAVDPLDAPGVGSAAQDGIAGRALVEALAQLLPNPRLVAVEITEYNPFLDIDSRTERLILALLRALLPKSPN